MKANINDDISTSLYVILICICVNINSNTINFIEKIARNKNCLFSSHKILRIF